MTEPLATAANAITVVVGVISLFAVVGSGLVLSFRLGVIHRDVKSMIAKWDAFADDPAATVMVCHDHARKLDSVERKLEDHGKKLEDHGNRISALEDKTDVLPAGE